VFNICCPEEDVKYYDESGISQNDFLTIYNEGIQHLTDSFVDEEENSDEEEEQPIKKKKLVKLTGDLVHKLGPNAELIIREANTQRKRVGFNVESIAGAAEFAPRALRGGEEAKFAPPREPPMDKTAMIEKVIAANPPSKKIMSPDELKAPVNLVFIGHVDAGKSTICGQILLSTGKIDARTVEKYEKEAKEYARDSWWLAYVMDQNEEEKEKGKTVEVGKQTFETETKRITILDAPGHKNYVPNMIGGTSQADYACLVISSRIGEFETGFERGGQTREHSLLAKSAGI
jgi:hypothetical protein